MSTYTYVDPVAARRERLARSEARIARCDCGSWRYANQSCAVCAALLGRG